MKVTPDDYGRRCQFDHFCKLVLYHEAVDYFRERKRQRGWETSFETLPLSELDTLCTIDQYPSDSFIFPAYPYTFFLHYTHIALSSFKYCSTCSRP